jgi:hypothetical protein
VSALVEIRNLSKVYERGAQKVEALHLDKSSLIEPGGAVA